MGKPARHDVEYEAPDPALPGTFSVLIRHTHFPLLSFR